MSAIDDFMKDYKDKIEALYPALSRQSSVPENGFRPIETLDDLQERFFDACCILSNVCSYLSQHKDGSWELARAVQDAAIDLHTTLVDTRYSVGTPKGDA